MAFRWCTNDGPTLNAGFAALWFFRGSVLEWTLQKMFVMSLGFVEIKNIENMSMGISYRTHLALQLLYCDLFLMKQYNGINPDV